MSGISIRTNAADGSDRTSIQDQEPAGRRPLPAQERRWLAGTQYELPGLYLSADEIHALLTMQHLLAHLDASVMSAAMASLLGRAPFHQHGDRIPRQPGRARPPRPSAPQTRDTGRVGAVRARRRPKLTFPSQRAGDAMKFRNLLVACAMLLSGAAFAFHCPADMKKIDEALAKNPSLSAEQMAEVKKLRAEGEALHQAGKHQESVDTLAKAMKILKVS
jgi:hypothetical protein